MELSKKRLTLISWAVTLAFIVVAASVSPFAIGFLNLTSSNFNPNAQSREVRWMHFVAERFGLGEQIFYNSFYIIISTGNESEKLTTPCRQKVLEEYTLAYYTAGLLYGNVSCVSSFFTATCVYPSMSPSLYLADSNSTVLLVTSIAGGTNPKEEANFIEAIPVQSFFDKSDCPVKVSMEHSGLLEMTGEMKKSIFGDLERIDTISIPLAFAFASGCAKSIRSVIVTIGMLFISLLFGFAILHPLAASKAVIFSAVTPEVVVAIVAALSIDYSLFLLTSFWEVKHIIDSRLHPRAPVPGGADDEEKADLDFPEIAETIAEVSDDDSTSDKQVVGTGEHRGINDNDSDVHGSNNQHTHSAQHEPRFIVVKAALTSTMTNISFSASTISGVYAVTAIMSEGDLLRGMTIAACISVLCCSLVALVFAPCLLYVMYPFLTCRVQCLETAERWIGEAWKRLTCCLRSSSPSEQQARKPLVVSTSPECAFCLARRRSPWYKTATFVTDHPFLCLAGCLVLISPLIAVLYGWNQSTAPGYRVGFNVYEEAPTNTIQTQVYRSVSDRFSPTLSPPFYMLFDLCAFDATTQSSNCTSRGLQEWQYQAMGDVAQRIEAVAASKGVSNIISQIIAPNLFEGQRIPFANVSTPNGTLFCGSDASVLSHVTFCLQWSMLFNAPDPRNATAGVVAVVTSRDSMGEIGSDMFAILTEVLANEGVKYPPNFLAGIYGNDLASYGCMNEAYRGTVKIFVVASAVIIGAMLVAFRSVMLSVRLVFTIGYTLICSFGITVLIFCFSFLHHGVIPELHHIGSIQWVMPFLGAPLIGALAVDYDAFLLSRVIQLRERFFTNKAAVVFSVFTTGRVITYAAAIMTIAFGSLTLSHSIMVQQFGTMILVAVFVDAVVVRTVFVPALMQIFPSLMWWPRKMPDPIYDETHCSHQLAHEGAK